jgi:hypothetical protein
LKNVGVEREKPLRGPELQKTVREKERLEHDEEEHPDDFGDQRLVKRNAWALDYILCG